MIIDPTASKCWKCKRPIERDTGARASDGAPVTTVAPAAIATPGWEYTPPQRTKSHKPKSGLLVGALAVMLLALAAVLAVFR